MEKISALGGPVLEKVQNCMILAAVQNRSMVRGKTYKANTKATSSKHERRGRETVGQRVHGLPLWSL